MKAKLIKTEVNYILEDDKGVVIASTSLNKEGLSLSLKNCQSIERGYDLDELDNRAFDDMGYHSKVTLHEEKQFKLGYRIAFREALELMGDKKFSEKDVRKAIEIARKGSMQEQHNGYGRPTELRFVLDDVPSDDIIKSLQQTEWDVTFNPEELDADGCLILKVKSE